MLASNRSKADRGSRDARGYGAAGRAEGPGEGSAGGRWPRGVRWSSRTGTAPGPFASGPGSPRRRWSPRCRSRARLHPFSDRRQALQAAGL